MPYAVVRACGLTTEDEDMSFLMEARQVGDTQLCTSCAGDK